MHWSVPLAFVLCLGTGTDFFGFCKTILQSVHEKALNAFSKYRVGERVLSKTAEAQLDDAWKNELATFGGQVRLVAVKSVPTRTSSAAGDTPPAEQPALPCQTEYPPKVNTTGLNQVSSSEEYPENFFPTTVADFSANEVENSHDSSCHSQMQKSLITPQMSQPTVSTATVSSTQFQIPIAQRPYEIDNDMFTMPITLAFNHGTKPTRNTWSYADSGVDTAWSSLMLYTGLSDSQAPL